MIRVLLDEHVSGPVIGGALTEAGLDIRAADSDDRLRRTDDIALFEIARSERRVLITNNTKDFAPIVRGLAERGDDHFGMIFVPHNIHARDFGSVIRQLRALLVHSTEDDWLNRVEWTHRRST